MRQLLGFGSEKHDDAVDALSHSRFGRRWDRRTEGASNLKFHANGCAYLL
jgi:hypothetical protein